MDEKRQVKMILEAREIEKNEGGRPRTTWNNSTAEALQNGSQQKKMMTEEQISKRLKLKGFSQLWLSSILYIHIFTIELNINKFILRVDPFFCSISILRQ